MGGNYCMKKTNRSSFIRYRSSIFLRPNDPFTWSSGIKSPIYCDNRLTLSFPNVRKDIATGLQKN
ncbi:hypothetical protein GCM10020331_046310 [Ectobacillus funiculus]